MQVFIKKLTDNRYLLPLLVVTICVWRIFVPQLPANEGLGWDGYRYYQLTVDGLQSKVLDSYLILRIFPCLLIHIILKWLSISFIPAHVILAFKIMNTIMIGLSAVMVKQIFEQYKLNPVSQLIGFTLVFLNYGVFNFTYYYPVMTDTPAFFLSIALFYFFVRGELTNVFLIGLIGAFTWPVIFAMAFALILFPEKEIAFVPLKKVWQYTISTLCLLYLLAMAYFLLFITKEKADLLFCLPINYNMLPIALAGVGVLFFFIPQVIFNQTFFNLNYYRSALNGNRIFAAFVLVIAFLVIRFSVAVNATSEYVTLYHQIKIHLVYAFQRPFITVVSHFNYFGCTMLLLLLFWKRFAAFVSGFGLGIAGSVFFCLFVFALKPESRALIFFFPWLMILMSLYIGKYRFSNLFYILVFVLNFAMAKLWLFFDYDMNTSKVLTDGTFDFPNQWFMMHLGIWMNEYVWLWLCTAVAVSLLLFIISLYKIEFHKKAVLFYKIFEPVTYE